MSIYFNLWEVATINIEKISDQQLIQHKYRAPTSHVFSLITNQRKWIFACKSSAECDIWINRILYFVSWKYQKEIKKHLQNFNDNNNNNDNEDIATTNNNNNTDIINDGINYDNNNNGNNNNNFHDGNDIKNIEHETNRKIIKYHHSLSVSNINDTNNNKTHQNSKHRKTHSESSNIGFIPTIMRKISDVSEWIGITEQYSVITSTQQKKDFS